LGIIPWLHSRLRFLPTGKGTPPFKALCALTSTRTELRLSRIYLRCTTTSIFFLSPCLCSSKASLQQPPLVTMVLDEDSRSLSPLPESLSRGLVAVSTFGLLSFFCSTSLFLYLTWRLISWHRYSGTKQPTNQFLLLIYNLLFADIQQACAFLLNIGALRDNAILVGKPLCFAQGWFVSTGDLASSVFISAIAVHTFFGVVRNYRLPTWGFYCAVALCWVFIYAMAAIGPILHGKDFYVRASAWVCLAMLREYALTQVSVLDKPSILCRTSLVSLLLDLRWHV
jgi:hypothetical protein